MGPLFRKLKPSWNKWLRGSNPEIVSLNFNFFFSISKMAPQTVVLLQTWLHLIKLGVDSFRLHLQIISPYPCLISLHTLSHTSPVPHNVCVYVCVSGSVVSSCLWPLGLEPARVLCPWNSPGKNTGVDCHFLLQGIFPTQGSNSGLHHCRQILYVLNHGGLGRGFLPPREEGGHWMALPSNVRAWNRCGIICWCMPAETTLDAFGAWASHPVQAGLLQNTKYNKATLLTSSMALW